MKVPFLQSCGANFDVRRAQGAGALGLTSLAYKVLDDTLALLRKIVKKLANAGVLGPCRSSLIEPPSFDFDRTCLLAVSIETQRAYRPHGRTRHES